MGASGTAILLKPVVALMLADAVVTTPVEAGAPLPIDYALPAAEVGDAGDRARWSLPKLRGDYGRRVPPRLRFNGHKVKLRVPIG